MSGFRPTPVETYEVQGRTVYVKREDLCGEPPLPPLAKVRGLHRHIAAVRDSGVDLVGVCDTRISKSGQGVAVICRDLGLRCWYFFPARKEERLDGSWLTEPRRVAGEMGAELRPLQAGRIGVVFAEATRTAHAAGGWMLPLGFPVFETVEETASVVAGMDRQLLAGTVVVPTGTGTILAGLLAGLVLSGVVPRRVVGVSAGMDTRRTAVKATGHLVRWLRDRDPSLRSAVQLLLNRVDLQRGAGDYYDPAEHVPPWPAHPHYEGKAYDWLLRALAIERTGRLPEPVLFYNCGA